MSNTNPTVLLNGDQIYLDELIRENARLTVQREAYCQSVKDLRDRITGAEEYYTHLVEEYEKRIAGYKEDLDGLIEFRNQTEETIPALQKKLANAINDLHTVMAGGNPCDVCLNKCPMGTTNCTPAWRGSRG